MKWPLLAENLILLILGLYCTGPVGLLILALDLIYTGPCLVLGGTLLATLGTPLHQPHGVLALAAPAARLVRYGREAQARAIHATTSGPAV